MDALDPSLRQSGRPPSCTCGECHKCGHAAYMREQYRRKTPGERRAYVARRDPERVRAVEVARSRTPGKRESIARSQLRHPDRHAARVAVHNAVARGHLVRQPCHCGVARSEAHHPDYTRRLVVEWLCRRHHVERHAT